MPDLTPKDPFITATWVGTDGVINQAGHITVSDRLFAVKSFNRQKCLDALEIDQQQPYLQTSVRVAIKRRLRRLDKMEATQ